MSNSVKGEISIEYDRKFLDNFKNFVEKHLGDLLDNYEEDDMWLKYDFSVSGGECEINYNIQFECYEFEHDEFSESILFKVNKEGDILIRPYSFTNLKKVFNDYEF